VTLSPFQPKPKACKHCGNSFLPLRSMQAVCGPLCAARLVKKERAATKVSVKARKAALKTPSELEQDCRRIVQKIARLRDRDDGCISCDKGPHWDGQWHGSHFRSVGACSALSLCLWNIHKACSVCNHQKSGNLEGYRPRIIAKVGQERVDWMLSQNQITRRSREYLERFKAVMGKRLRRMERRIACS
jgi:hypothetical protein